MRVSNASLSQMVLRPRSWLLLAIATVVAGAGCRSDHITAVNLDGLPAGVEARLVVEPSTVVQRGSFVVRLTVRNTTADTIDIETLTSCLVLPGVYRNGTRQPFLGTGYGCFNALSLHRYEPGQTKALSWKMQAWLDPDVPGVTVGAVPPVGDYEVQMRFDTRTKRDLQPVLKRRLSVR